MHNRKEAAASYQFKEKLNVILGEKIKGQSKKGMEYFEMKGDTGEDSDDENDESYADSSFSSENEGEKLENLRTSSTDESNKDSVFEDNESNNSQSESDQDSSFYESDTESKFVNAPQQATYIRSFSPSNSEDLSSSYTSESTDGSVYSNSPITLGLFRRDTNGTLQHKVILKNVQKKAATTLQRFARLCLRTKRANLRLCAILCLQKYIRQRQACQKSKKDPACTMVHSGVQRFLATKIIRNNFFEEETSCDHHKSFISQLFMQEKFA